jgi:signal transduction histidine kinase
MKLFTVLEPPDGKPERVAFVPEAFSWGALVFTVLWALWHRMWVVAVLLFALSAVLTVGTNLELLGPGLAALVNFGISLLFAFEARALQVKSLERVGFRRRALIQASNREAAELAYFAGRAPLAPEPAPSRLPARHDDTLGIFGNS